MTEYYNPVDTLKEVIDTYNIPAKATVTGGPSDYYNIPPNCVTLNDLMEHKAYTSWGGDALHLKDIMKASWRWGEKDGTTKAYDARKIIYFAARLLQIHAGQDAVRELLSSMLNDPQFNTNNKRGTQ